MNHILLLIKDKFYYYYTFKASFLYLLVLLTSFIFYALIDGFNTFIFNFYPIYHTVYSQGAADSIYFSYAVNNLLSFHFSNINFDSGVLELLIYTLPVGLSEFFHVNLGYSFRLFYVLFLLATGYGILLTAKKIYSEQTAFLISLSFIFNPFIFILSVWAGSDETVEAFFFVYILYFIANGNTKHAILLVLLASFFKYYTILLLPLLLFSIQDSQLRLKVTTILATFFAIVGSVFLLFLPKYVNIVLNTFIFSFNPHGKGFYNILLEYNIVSNRNEVLTLSYYFFMLLVYFVLLLKLRNSDEIYKYGIIFVVFFLLYPEFFSSYLIIPLVVISLLYPISPKFLKIINFIILPLASLLSEFAFTSVDSPYALFHLEPTFLLRFMGTCALVILYLVILSWVYFYARFGFKQTVS